MSDGHHMWCNFGNGDPSTCRQCNQLWNKYPYDKEGGIEMIEKHFPDAKIIKSPTPEVK